MPLESETDAPAMQVHFLGQIPFGLALELQHRLVRQAAACPDGQIHVLMCEHPAVVTIGRDGAPAEVQMQARVLRSRQIEICWVKRGGGCLVHAPGQLAVYPIVPLRWHGLSVGDYVECLQGAVVRALEELGVECHMRPERQGIWGRTGQLAAFGVGVRDWVTCHGAFLNVCPPLGLMRLVESDAVGRTSMSCLVAERQGRVTMTSVRAELVRQLGALLGCDRWHVHTGHPWLRRAN